MDIVITSPSLDTATNVSGISSVVSVIIGYDSQNRYRHFLIGRPDGERRGVRWLARLLRMYGRWLGVVCARRGAIIHFNLALDRLSLLRDSPMILAARIMRRRLLVHVHGGQLFTAFPSEGWLGWVVRKVLVGRHRMIVLGRREAELFLTASHRARVEIMPNCVDLRDARGFTRSFEPSAPVTLLFMGRIEPRKGLDIICEAVEILRSRDCPIRFVLAGAGPDAERYAARLRDVLGTDFTFAGVVSEGRKAALLRESDVFVLPSFFEGLPMALLESMAFGLVPITTDVGAIGDVVTNGANGILLGTRSPEELAHAVELVVSDPAVRRRLSMNARRFVFEHHDPASYVTRLNEIYRDELRSRTS